MPRTTERKYIAFADDNFGGDHEIIFYSMHRANSKANKEDAMREWLHHHSQYFYGKKLKIKIKHTRLADEYE